MNEAEKILSELKKLEKRSIVVLGWRLPYIASLYPQPAYIVYRYLLSQEDLAEATREELKIYYLPQIRERNLKKYGVDLKKIGAAPIRFYK